MVDYEVAFKKPFSDIKKLLLAIVLNIIPIVNFIVYGYFLEVARSSNGKKPSDVLPEWKNYGNLFISGLFSFVIGLFYLLPLFVVMIIIFAAAHVSMLAYMQGGSSIEGLLPAAVASLGLWALLLLVLLVTTAYFLPSAILSFAITGEVSSAFELGSVVKNALNKEYFVVWLVSIIYSAVLGGLLGLIPYVGTAVAGAVTGITMFTLLGEVYPNLMPVKEHKKKK